MRSQLRVTRRLFSAILVGLTVAASFMVETPAGAVGSEEATRYIVSHRSASGSGGLLAKSVSLDDTIRIVGGEVVGHVGAYLAADLTAHEFEVLSRYADVTIERDAWVTASSEVIHQPVSTDNWGLDRLDEPGAGLDGRFPSTNGGEGVSVYVLDSGIDVSHDEFEGRVGEGRDFIGDGNGVGDCNGHGTLVASLATGATVGAARLSTVYPVRVLGCDGGGWSSDVAAGIDWVRSHRTGPSVINLSLGGGPSDVLDKAVERATDDGIVVVVAAGNDGADACDSSPGRVIGAVTVGSSTMTDAVAPFTDIGSCVDLYAPGVELVGAQAGTQAGFQNGSGTSVSAPLVAGIAAVVLGDGPGLGVHSATEVLIDAALPVTVTGAASEESARVVRLPTYLDQSLARTPVVESYGWGQGAAGDVWLMLSLRGMPGSVAGATTAGPGGEHSHEVTIGQDGTGVLVWAGVEGRYDVKTSTGTQIGAGTHIVVVAVPRQLGLGVRVVAEVRLENQGLLVGLQPDRAGLSRFANLTVSNGDQTLVVSTNSAGQAWLLATASDTLVVDGLEWIVSDDGSARA